MRINTETSHGSCTTARCSLSEVGLFSDTNIAQLWMRCDAKGLIQDFVSGRVIQRQTNFEGGRGRRGGMLSQNGPDPLPITSAALSVDTNLCSLQFPPGGGITRFEPEENISLHFFDSFDSGGTTSDELRCPISPHSINRRITQFAANAESCQAALQTGEP